MATAVVMPKAGITVEFCIIGEWLKKPGDRIEIGDVLFNYETDKASFECESTAAGELLACFFEAGDEVPCLANVCAVGKNGEDVSALSPNAGAAPADSVTEEKAELVKAVEPVITAASSSGGTGISPRARGLAERAGVDASMAAATGPNGRVIERDVRKYMEEGSTTEASPLTAKIAPAAQEAEYEDVKFSGIRRAISKSMHQSLSSMAQLTHHHSFDATELQKYRAKLKAMGGDYAGITLGDMVLFAVSRTLSFCPDLNANMLDDNSIRRFKNVNLGVAVSTDRGLMVPTVFSADKKTLSEISAEVKELAGMCRSGSISPDLLKGGSFTVSNLGAYNVEVFTPVVNPPQTGILGVCTIVQRPRKSADGGIELYPAMGLSLTYDHRAVDGAPASAFVTELSKNLESFTALLAH